MILLLLIIIQIHTLLLIIIMIITIITIIISVYIYIYTYIDMHRHRCIHTCYTYIVSYDSIHSTVYRIILHYTGARLLPGAPSGPRRSVARC